MAIYNGDGMEVDISIRSLRAIEQAVRRVVGGSASTDMEEYVTTKEAARLLGISQKRLRQIKDRFPHTKQGDNGQGRLRFLRCGLMKSYVE